MKKLREWLIANHKWTAVGLVLAITLLTYAPFLSRMGFYQDDWYLLWSARARGAGSIISLFSIDRPFMGYINYLDYLILGDNVILWQWYALLWRLLLGWGVLWLLRLIWPKIPTTTTMMTLLVVVYPGFLSQPVAMNYKNYIFEFALAVYSMVAMVYALRTQSQGKRIGLWGLSVLLTLVYILLYEFMIGLEGLRLALLFYLIWREKRQDWQGALQASAKQYIPFGVIIIGFVVWRFFIFESQRASTSEARVLIGYLTSPVSAGLRLVFELGKDIIETVFFSWAVPAYQLMAGSRYGVLGPALLLAGIGVGMVYGYRYGYRYLFSDQDDEQDGADFFWLGVVGVLAALAAVVVPGRDVRFNGFERYTLHASLGMALLLGGLLSALKENYRTGLFLLLIGIGISTHYHNANLWAERWALETDSWWQLTWRAPGLQADTVLIASIPAGFEQDYEVWGPVNLIYWPDVNPPAVKSQVLLRETTYLIERGLGENDHLRDIEYFRDYDNVLIVSRPTPQSCLHVIDGNLPFLSQFEDSRVEKVAAYSNIDQVLIGDAVILPPKNIFGSEPPHGWCYLYQRASLARQMGDWKLVSHFGEQAIAADLKPVDRAEWMPFFEGFVITGRNDDAKWLSTILKSDKNLRFSLCSDLESAEMYPEKYDYDGIFTLLCAKDSN